MNCRMARWLLLGLALLLAGFTTDPAGTRSSATRS